MWQADTTRTNQDIGAVCGLLHRAYRDTRFYPTEHPVPAETLARLTEAFTGLIAQLGTVTLEVEEGQLVFGEETVYSHEESRDNLAFIMFREGLRVISFHPGLEADEIHAFVQCLAQVDDLAGEERDLLTAFWEEDFTHIDYSAADQILGGGVLREGTLEALRETVLRRLEETDMSSLDLGSESEARGSIVPRLGTRTQDLLLTHADLEESERQVQEMAAALDDFGAVLLELLVDKEVAGDYEQVLKPALAAVVNSYARASDLDGLCSFLEQIRTLESENECPDGTAGRFAAQAIPSERLAEMVDAGTGFSAYQPAVERLLDLVQSWDSLYLLELLTTSQNRNLRRFLLGFLERGGALRGERLIPLLGDARWYVVRNALRLARSVRDPSLLSRIERLTTHPDARVRREAVRTVDALAGREALAVLTRALLDSDSTVRTVAARSALRCGGPDQERALLAQVTARHFSGRPAEEIDAMLTALVDLMGERAFPTLRRFLSRVPFRSAPLSVRISAVVALGNIRGDAADGLLHDVSRCKEEPLRLAARRALVGRAS
jgi:HEAT repeat protein